jgi:hypothetical protein
MKLIRISTLSGAVLASMMAFSSLSFADFGSHSLSLGGQLGGGVLSDGGGTNLELGVEGLYNLIGPISVGGYVDYLSRGSIIDPLNGNTISGSYFLYGGQAMYDFGGLLPGLSLGARVGLARNSRSVQLLSNGAETNIDDTNFSIGPVAEYDVALNQTWSAGGEVNWQISSGSNVNNVVGILATLKYWF